MKKFTSSVTYHYIIIFTTILFCPIKLFCQSAPVKARVANVADSYFGTTITDPYRWMEDSKAPEMQQFMQSQSDYAHYYLQNLPLRNTFLDRLNSLDNAGTLIYSVRKRGEKYFYFKQQAGENNPKVYMREGISGSERLLVNPETYSHKGKQSSVTSFSPSPDGHFMSFLIADGGGEYGMIRVLKTATGKITGDVIENTRWDAGNWTQDSRAFSYNKFQKLPHDAQPTERMQKIAAWLHTLNTKPSADKPLFGYGIDPNIKLDASPIASVYFPLEAKYAVAQFNDGVSQNSDFYIAPMTSINQPVIPWKKIVGLADNVRDVAQYGNHVYLLTYKDASRFKIVRINADKPDLKTAETVLPASDAVIENFSPAKDGLYVGVLDGGIRRIYCINYKSLKAVEIKTANPGSVYIRDCQPNRNGILIGLNSWTRSNGVYEYNPDTKTVTDTEILKPIAVDMSGIEVTNLKVKSHDGVMVPLVILHKKGMPFDGRNPLIMRGYGSYGVEITSPFFNTGDLPWLERGGIVAFAGIRGGGEYGEEWHMGGYQKTKPNTWKDFIACAEYLIDKKYTAPEHLGIQGGSAGGILISNAVAERPELFGAAVINVGINNILRYETTANGVLNIGEFGTSTTKEGFETLAAMDGYHKIRDGVKYPAVLLTHGINDPRVEPWMSTKMAARLHAATASAKPIYLRIEYDGGHGIGSSRKQYNEEAAETFAFFSTHLGGK